MKTSRILSVIVICFIANLSFAQQQVKQISAKNHQIEIQTSAICGMCKNRIEKELYLSKGIKEANLNLENKVITVNFNPKKTDLLKIKQIIASVGYNADKVERDKKAFDELPRCCRVDEGHGKHDN